MPKRWRFGLMKAYFQSWLKFRPHTQSAIAFRHRRYLLTRCEGSARNPVVNFPEIKRRLLGRNWKTYYWVELNNSMVVIPLYPIELLNKAGFYIGVSGVYQSFFKPYQSQKFQRVVRIIFEFFKSLFCLFFGHSTQRPDNMFENI